MKKTILMGLTLLFTVSTFAQKGLNPHTYAFINLKNNSGIKHKDYPVTIKISDITSLFHNYTGQRLGIFKGKGEIQSQMDDLDKDGVADEISFLIDIDDDERLLVRMLPPNYEIPNFEKELFVELVTKEKQGDSYKYTLVEEISSKKDDMYNKMHHHGVAFETEQIAYRIYFDKKQTIDVYGKITPRLEIPMTQWYPSDKQMASGKYGTDILKVGSSVGVGSFKGWDGKQAMHFDSVQKRTQRIVAKGNIRNVVETELEGWYYQGKSINTKIRYIQYARHRDVKVEIIFPEDFKDSLIFTTGVLKLKDEKFHTDNSNLVGSWGWTFPEPKDTIKWCRQTMGAGVFVPEKYAKVEATDKRNHLILISNNGTPTLSYYLTAAGLIEKKGYKNSKDFFEYLDNWKNELMHPVEVSITEK